jgi:predicted alpha/beta-hydrolase family hydrolase
VVGIEPFEFVSGAGPAVYGFLHRPARPARDAIVLTHGAGSDCDAPLLVALATAFADRGAAALRCDLPFRQARPQGPPAPATAERDRAGIRQAVGVLRQLAPGRILLGGHSYGGRQGSMLLADDPHAASALLLLAYPLHPPGRPSSLRSAHLTGIRVPTLFVHGTRDPFGTIEEIEAARALIPAPTALLTVEAGHDLGHGRGGAALPALAQRIASAFLALSKMGGPGSPEHASIPRPSPRRSRTPGWRSRGP